MLGQLAATLNGLLDRLSASLRREQRFSAELTHELRTPLATICGEAELALRREREPSAYRTALQNVLANAQTMARAIDTLVAAQRQQTGLARGSAAIIAAAAPARPAYFRNSRLSGIGSIAPGVAPRGVDGRPGLARSFRYALEGALRGQTHY